MIYLSYAASYPSFIDSQTPKLPMGNKFSVTFAIGIVAMILLVIFIVIASKIRRAWIKVTKLKDCSFVPQQNGGKAANQINARAASSSFGQPLQQTTNRPQLQGTAPQSCRRCGLGNLQLGQQRLTRSLQLGHGRLQSGVGLPPPLGGGLQTGRHQHSPGLQGLGKQLPLRGGVKVKRATQKINTADIRHSSVQQQVESIGNSATTNTQVPTIPERQGFLYIPRQPGCVHNVDRGSNKTADTLNTLEESVSQGITSKLTPA